MTDNYRVLAKQYAVMMVSNKPGTLEWNNAAEAFDYIHGGVHEHSLQLLSMFHEAVERRYSEIWHGIVFGFLIWITPPTLLLAIGFASIWAISGFRREDGK